MSEAPPSPGGTRIPRDDAVRWIEPAAPLFIEPEQDVAIANGVAGRDTVRWRDVSWVDFVSPEPERTEASDRTWSVTRVPATDGGEEAWQEQPPEPAEASTPHVEAAEIPPVHAEPARIRPTQATTRRRERPWTLSWCDVRRIGVVRLSRIGQFSIALVALATILGLSYEGGERLAGLAGAMTPPSSRGRPTKPAMSPESKPAPVDEAGARAAAFLERANAGDAAAQYNVAVLYARGEGLVQDFTSAAAWFQKAAAAGNPAAQFNLGVLYQRGFGVSQDSTEALRWYKRAAERHYAPAEYNLAIAYAQGQGTPRDPVAAARWYHRAAAQGLVQAMINFAILYEKGEGVERSPVDAYAWYHGAALRGDVVGEKRAAELFAGFDAASRKLAQSLATEIAASVRQARVELAGTNSASGEDTDTKSPN